LISSTGVFMGKPANTGDLLAHLSARLIICTVSAFDRFSSRASSSTDKSDSLGIAVGGASFRLWRSGPRRASSLLIFEHSNPPLPLEAHLPGAIVAPQGPKDQPAHASIEFVARNKDRRICVISKYLSTYLLARCDLLEACLTHASNQQRFRFFRTSSVRRRSRLPERWGRIST
jgi:hypothetical protein